MFKTLRKLVLAAGMFLAAVGPAAAFSTQTTAAGSLTADYASGTSSLPSGLFLNYWTFTLATDSLVSGLAVNQATSPGKMITDFTAQFLNSTATPITTFTSANYVLPGGVTLQTLSTAVMQLSAGSYSMLVAGVAGSGGPAFNVNLSVSPVPEPGVYGMLLAGLGLIGAIARRRRA